jgi:hypothetical protein
MKWWILMVLGLGTMTDVVPADVDDACYGCCHMRMCREVCSALDKNCEPCLRECLERAKAPDCRAKECGEKTPPPPSKGLQCIEE